MEERDFHAENLEVRVYSTRREMGQAAAGVISRQKKFVEPAGL